METHTLHEEITDFVSKTEVGWLPINQVVWCLKEGRWDPEIRYRKAWD